MSLEGHLFVQKVHQVFFNHLELSDHWMIAYTGVDGKKVISISRPMVLIISIGEQRMPDEFGEGIKKYCCCIKKPVSEHDQILVIFEKMTAFQCLKSTT